MRRTSSASRARNRSPQAAHANITKPTPPATPALLQQHSNGTPPAPVSSAYNVGARRESLVKPTWQHITPGQIPPKTLDKINGITSDDSDDDDYPRRPSVIVHQHVSNNNNSSSGRKVSGGTGDGCSSNGLQRRSSFAHPTRAYGLVVHTDSPKTGTARPTGTGSGSSVGAVAAVAAADSGGAGGAGICQSAGRALIRMMSATTTTTRAVCSEEEDDFDILGKVIMLGDSGVGKTCLLIRFRDGKYLPSYYITTVGIDFRNKVVVVDGTRVKLQIWDTAGQERFRSVTHAYYRDAHALLLLYDVTNKTTYDNIRAWLGEIREYAQDDVVIVLIGNKADCSSSDRQVKREDGERLAREHNVPFMETSAKTGLNVELAFAAVARQLKSRGTENGDDGKFNVHDFVRDNTRARTICAQCKSM